MDFKKITWPGTREEMEAAATRCGPTHHAECSRTSWATTGDCSWWKLRQYVEALEAEVRRLEEDVTDAPKILNRIQAVISAVVCEAAFGEGKSYALQHEAISQIDEILCGEQARASQCATQSSKGGEAK